MIFHLYLFFIFVSSSFLLTDIARWICVKCTKDMFAKFISSAIWIQLFVDLDEFFSIQVSRWTILLQAIENKTSMIFKMPRLSSLETNRNIFLLFLPSTEKLHWSSGIAKHKFKKKNRQRKRLLHRCSLPMMPLNLNEKDVYIGSNEKNKE